MGRRLLGSAVVLVALFGEGGGAARAEDKPTIEYADGVDDCRAFLKKNAKEQADFEKQQPATPYKYPHEDTVLGAPWGPFFHAIASDPDLMLATVLPHFGAQLRDDAPAALIALPWSFPLGPAYTCSRKQGSFDVGTHQAHRAMLEPGITSGDRGTGFYTRVGYRFMYQPSDWVVGAGGGVGSTIEIHGNREPFRPSLSPEVVISFGHCCAPGYVTLSFRYDHFFAGDENNLLSGMLGYVYF